MATTVLILGAGASKKAGAPLMAEFLDVAHDLWKTGQVSEVEDSFSTVFRGIGMLQQVHSKSQLDIQNVESVFAAFEMARTLGRFGAYGLEEVSALVDAMRVVIVKTIERTLLFPISNGTIMPPEPYAALAGVVGLLRDEARPKHSVAIITFNYDLATEYALLLGRIPIDYSLGPDGSEGEGAVPLLKLHGSTNWGWCKECEKVIPWMLRDYVANMQVQIHADVKAIRMPVGSQLVNARRHGHPLEAEPILVPPTWDKSEYRRNLASVWARAAAELGGAENVFVLGYSMPRSDEFFRYLYALGTVGEVPLKRFWVFNPDESQEIRDRFEDLLGPGALQRYAYRGDTFGEALQFIASCFRRSN
ncbi:MAG TPA: hypothetical protein VE222_00060, partial [Nitrospiraceae bacterium]|nr:hypothetical protein [Nitrospiraceae bacterium]